ncbi:rRNA biogenesis protein rrp36 [Elasticomyces elasticus]|nr:rRNA biogenesis protein rrp36 [Elasticomyces elasticus]KAK3636132.1 rRNA biogenesis protein rrp36 [Elasticomyces elasticus]KAK4912099.1 rRNA biogenesis protein rrp36 [Elasticomyces elasticus]KAK5753655.1 rRNA biogenesis protein rrp36 [Elasticomyces elasticus]
MAPVKKMDRNVRVPKIVHQEDDEDEDVSQEEEMAEEEEESGSEMDGEVQNEEDEDVQVKISNISFGALKQAQDAVGSQKRKRDSNDSPAAADDDKLEALRKRLKQIKEQKGSIPTTTKTVRDDAEDSNGSDSDSAPSEEGGNKKSRTSKHAPASQTTKHQVTRKRTVISYPKLVTRDPRFDNIPFQAPNTSVHAPNDASDKAYAFLRDYQKDEVGELRAALRKTKDEDEKELLRRKINSMENRLKSHAAKEREQAVRAEHRREEKGRVLEGKKPYFLKDKEVKERALVKKFEGMKGREREKIVAKRALKESQKEKRAMPRDRRLAR